MTVLPPTKTWLNTERQIKQSATSRSLSLLYNVSRLFHPYMYNFSKPVSVLWTVDVPRFSKEEGLVTSKTTKQASVPP